MADRKIIITYNKSTKKRTVLSNAEYLEMIDRSTAQFQNSETISFSMEELKEMEADDWKPTQKIEDFMGTVAKCWGSEPNCFDGCLILCYHDIYKFGRRDDIGATKT